MLLHSHAFLSYFCLADSKMLNKFCDDILNNEITCEEVIQDDEMVSSTEASPVKIATPPTKRRKGSASVRMLQMSKKAKNEEILSATKSSYCSEIPRQLNTQRVLILFLQRELDSNYRLKI